VIGATLIWGCTGLCGIRTHSPACEEAWPDRPRIPDHEAFMEYRNSPWDTAVRQGSGARLPRALSDERDKRRHSFLVEQRLHNHLAGSEAARVELRGDRVVGVAFEHHRGHYPTDRR
jgi:hypothetical protein